LKRDPIERLRRYLVEQKQWLTSAENEKLVADVDSYIESERAQAEASPMPSPETDAKHQGAYCEGNCHTVRPKYAEVKFGAKAKA
jgi:TPP-dependent pyruvate/acetoin dehydrogenase alpha subunit